MSDDSNESNSDSPAGMVENIGEQVASGLEGAAEGMEGEEGNEDVAKGLETAGDVASAASQGAAMVEGAQDMTEALREGDGLEAASAAGEYAGGLAGATGAVFDGAADLVDNEGVSEALQTAASVARGIGGAARAVRSVISTGEDIVQSLLGQKVKYELHFDGEGEWKVQGFTLTEAISEPYEMVLEVKTEDRDADPRALVGADAELLIERGDEHHRRITGVVRRVIESNDRSHHVSATVHVVPALWALGQGTDSVIFQDKTAVEILETVLTRALSPYGREVDVSDLGDGYARREYCVQYRESHLAFCQRLMEEEGISYGFDADGEGHEKLVLWDRNGGVAAVATADDAAIPFRNRVGIVTSSNEPIVELSPARKMTATAEVVRDYDWTQAQTRVEATVDGEDEQGRSRSVYDHGHGRTVSLYDFEPGQRYRENDVTQQGQRRREVLVRDADLSGGASLVIGMIPGRRFELTDHPTLGMDGHYLVTKVVHRKASPEGSEHHAEGEAYSNTFECIPLDVEWRPRRRMPKPSISGIQTAMVTGGNKGEIVTDEYGRVQVLFSWDREGIEPTSCWLRVAQVWAGHDGSGHPGFLFIPRVGMEAIVSFMDGDPDRPLVTGTVYNGTNRPPASLPDEASRSIIRTRSLGGDGYNELSFEDAGGQEEVHLRAERNLRELVRNDHDTHVLHDHTNTVDNDQELTVHGYRTKTVDKDESNTIKGTRSTRVGFPEAGNDILRVKDDRRETVGANRHVEVTEQDSTIVHGMQSNRVHNGLRQTVTNGVTQTIDSGGWTMETTGDVTHEVVGNADHSVQGSWGVQAGGNIDHVAAGAHTVRGRGVLVDSGVGGTTIQSQGEIVMTSPQKIQAISPVGIESISTGFSLEDLRIKYGAYMVSASLYATKIDAVTLMKVDLCKFKLYNDGLKVSLQKLSVGNTATAMLARAGVMVFG